MAFWGIELKPGKPYVHQYDDNERRRLHLSRATLGSGGSSKEKAVVVCNVSDKKPIYLCSLLPRKMETCSLSIEFEEYEEVTFSVEGPHNIHLSGFFYGEKPDGDNYESDSDEDGSSEGAEIDYGDDSFDDVDNLTDNEIDTVLNNEVRIEETVDDEKNNQQDNTPGGKSKGLASEAKPLHVRKYPCGLVVEMLYMGEPIGKRADPGKKISILYTGKLQKNGKIFDSVTGKAPFKFRLGVGKTIPGWDVGIKGMRVGDKRRLTVPPSMGYGTKGGSAIPCNSWLVFDIELVDVN